MRDTEVLSLIGADARDRLTGAYLRMVEAGADDETMRRVLADMLTSGQVAATIDGEALALRQMEELGIDTSPNRARITGREAQLGHARAADNSRKRYRSAVDTIMDGSPDADAVRTRLERLARAEAVATAQTASAALMRRARTVSGWTRQLDGDPCELCTWWHRDGRVWPSNHTMPTHKGCECAQLWVRVADVSIRDMSREGIRSSEERAEAGTLAERRAMHESEYSSSARGRGRAERGTVDRRRQAARDRRQAERDRRRGRR